METAIIVNGSIEFRDAVMSLARQGGEIYARREGTKEPVYWIRPGLTARITIDELFRDGPKPILMEDFAQALVHERQQGRTAPSIEIFAL